MYRYVSVSEAKKDSFFFNILHTYYMNDPKHEDEWLLKIDPIPSHVVNLGD